MTFYTYVYFDENFIPYYVGEGSRWRFLDKHRVPVPPVERILTIPAVSKDVAVETEEFLIKNMGRLDLGTGCLMNLTDGGPGCKNPCDDHRRVIRANAPVIGRIAGRIAVESGSLRRAATPESCARGGRNGNREGKRRSGLHARDSGQLASFRTHDHQVAASRIGNHVRHSSGGRIKAGCQLCQGVTV